MGVKVPWINIFLLVITIFTTVIAGAMQSGVNPLRDPLSLYLGLPFSISLIIILGAHELGHFIVSHKRGIKATLPYFIPAPTFLGTFGAFIKIKSPLPNRNVLLDIGIAGPLAGFIVAIPMIILGLGLSEVRLATSEAPSAGISLGAPIIFSLLSHWVLGVTTESHNIILHPIAFAGWIGLFVTALNLLPIGQLDGGHITYSLFQKKHRLIAIGTYCVLIYLGFKWPGWFVWGILLISLFGFRHPQPLDQITPLDTRRKVLGVIGIIIFLLSFTPVPFHLS
jgi:membrane-associated protease RseP (regulator of RpoE activity)